GIQLGNGINLTNGIQLGNGINLSNGFNLTNGVTLGNGLTRVAGLDLANGVQSNPLIGTIDLRRRPVRGCAGGPYIEAPRHSVLEAWIDTNPTQRQLFLKYMIQCALPKGVAVHLTYQGSSSVLGAGVADLGPSWQTGLMLTSDQQKVSSCLL